MEKSVKLMHDISDAEGHTAQIESDVKTIDKALMDIHDDLEISALVQFNWEVLHCEISMLSCMAVGVYSK